MQPEVSQRTARLCEARWLGRVDYGEGLRLQERAVEALKEGTASEQLLLLEHSHVFTLGRGAELSNVLADTDELNRRSIDLYETGRGGDVTYHGPGQLVGYPIIDLNPDRRDVHRYVRDIEEVLMRALTDLDIRGSRISGLTGVWVGEAKIGAIGVRIARWITSHGFALNVNTDLSYFGMIVPCGIRDKGVTSISQIIGRNADLLEVARIVSHRFAEVFDRQVGDLIV